MTPVNIFIGKGTQKINEHQSIPKTSQDGGMNPEATNNSPFDTYDILDYTVILTLVCISYLNDT